VGREGDAAVESLGDDAERSIGSVLVGRFSGPVDSGRAAGVDDTAAGADRARVDAEEAGTPAGGALVEEVETRVAVASAGPAVDRFDGPAAGVRAEVLGEEEVVGEALAKALTGTVEMQHRYAPCREEVIRLLPVGAAVLASPE
jgi:hypothetical protein